MTITNAQLAADLQATRDGWQAFVEQQLEWLVSEENEVTLTNPITADEVLVATFYKIVSDYEAVIDPATGAAAAAEDWANHPVDALVPQGNGVDEYSALHHATKAGQSASSAASSVAAIGSSVTDAQAARAGAESAETGAVSARNAAEGYRDSASSSATDAEAAEAAAVTARDAAVDAKDDAEAAATAAEGHADNASDSAAEAHDWANEDEDVVVSGGEYSAYHWAQKAIAASGVDLSGYATKAGGNTFSGTQVFNDGVSFNSIPTAVGAYYVVRSSDDSDQTLLMMQDSGANNVGRILVRSMNGAGADAEWRLTHMGLVNFQNTGHTVFNNSGNVGIGNSSPSAELEIGSSDTDGSLILGHQLTFRRDGLSYISTHEDGTLQFQQGSTPRFTISSVGSYTWDDDTGTERMRLTEDGYLGINITSPDRKLVVKNAETSGEAFAVLGNNDARGLAIEILTSGTVDRDVIFRNQLSNGHFVWEANTTQLMRINSSGVTFGSDMKVNGLAGTGTRSVVADSSGNLSAPGTPVFRCAFNDVASATGPTTLATPGINRGGFSVNTDGAYEVVEVPTDGLYRVSVTLTGDGAGSDERTQASAQLVINGTGDDGTTAASYFGRGMAGVDRGSIVIEDILDLSAGDEIGVSCYILGQTSGYGSIEGSESRICIELIP